MFPLQCGLAYKIENLIIFPVLATVQSYRDVGSCSSAKLMFNRQSQCSCLARRSFFYNLNWLWLLPELLCLPTGRVMCGRLFLSVRMHAAIPGVIVASWYTLEWWVCVFVLCVFLLFFRNIPSIPFSVFVFCFNLILPNRGITPDTFQGTNIEQYCACLSSVNLVQPLPISLFSIFHPQQHCAFDLAERETRFYCHVCALCC